MPSESFPVDRIERTLRQQLGIVLSPLRAIGLLRTLLLPLALVASLLLALPALSAAENTIRKATQRILSAPQTPKRMLDGISSCPDLQSTDRARLLGGAQCLSIER